MSFQQWLIYGASGFTADLIIQQALEKEQYPIIAGRDPEKISAIADKYKLPFRIFSLDHPDEIVKNLSDISLVLNCAGPFVHTSLPLVDACLKTQTHYFDITGEIPVFEQMFALDSKAKESKIMIISGIGFDVIPTDCMSKFIVDELPDADLLEIAFSGIASPTSGTMNSMLELIPSGGFIRKDGELVNYPLGRGAKTVHFQEIGETKVIPIPWGDLSTAYRTTSVPNIITYSAYPEFFIMTLPILEPMIRFFLTNQILRRGTQKIASWLTPGPDKDAMENSNTQIYVKASKKSGEYKEAWLTTNEAYKFTAQAALLCVEKASKSYLRGTLTPSQAFGKELVLQIPGSKMYRNI